MGVGSKFIVPQSSKVEIGRDCDIAPEVMFECGSHVVGPSSRRAGPGIANSISIGDGVWIGARALILGGADIGRGCIVGAGAVVVPGHYAPDSLLAGVPARIVKSFASDS